MLINPKIMLYLIILFGWVPAGEVLGRDLRLFDVFIILSFILFFNTITKNINFSFLLFWLLLLLQFLYVSIEWQPRLVYYVRFLELIILVRLLSIVPTETFNSIMITFFWSLLGLYLLTNWFGLFTTLIPQTQSMVQAMILLSIILNRFGSTSILANKNTILIVCLAFLALWAPKSYIVIGIICYIGIFFKDYYFSPKKLKWLGNLFLYLPILILSIYITYTQNLHGRSLDRLNGSIPIVKVIYSIADEQSTRLDNPLKSRDIVNVKDYIGVSVDESFSRKSGRYILMLQHLLRFPDNFIGVGLGGSKLRSPESTILQLLVEFGFFIVFIILIKYLKPQINFFIIIGLFGMFSGLFYTQITIVLCMLWVINNRKKKIKCMELIRE